EVPRRALDREHAAVQLHNSIGNAQPKAGTGARVLRREERIERMSASFVRHSAPRIVNFQNNAFVFTFRERANANHSLALIAQRVFRIAEQVKQYLLKLLAVTVDVRQ